MTSGFLLCKISPGLIPSSRLFRSSVNSNVCIAWSREWYSGGGKQLGKVFKIGKKWYLGGNTGLNAHQVWLWGIRYVVSLHDLR